MRAVAERIKGSKAEMRSKVARTAAESAFSKFLVGWIV
jgi:hypothetical protein